MKPYSFRRAYRASELIRPMFGPSGVSIGQTRPRSEEHTSELQSQSNLVCRLLLEKKKSDIETEQHTSQHQSQTNIVHSLLLLNNDAHLTCGSLRRARIGDVQQRPVYHTGCDLLPHS